MNIPVPLAFLSGSPGSGELLLVFAVILLVFGPKRLPEIARKIGSLIDTLRHASQDFRDQVMRLDEPPAIDVAPNEVTEDKTPVEPDIDTFDGPPHDSEPLRDEKEKNDLAG